MKRPVLNKVSLDDVMNGLLGGKPSATVTMSQGQWDRFLQTAYDAGHNLIEVDDNEIPVRAYRKTPDA
jgi:phosphosulfolactate synthase (CoM biosynthesis protein A)